MSKENVQAVRKLYEAFNRGDLETLEKGLAKKFERFEPENSLFAGGNPYRTPADVRKGVYEPRAREFDKWRTDIEQVFDAGDTVITTGRYHARCKATGKDLATQFCHVLHIDSSGKVDRLQAYTDTLKEAEVAGRVQPIQHVRMAQPTM
jgi:ketosteroid isomerase-like protein